MSAIGGIYSFDGAPIDEPLLIDLGNRLSFRGPDGGGEVLYDSIGMTYRAFHTNKESRLEHQPFVSRNKCILAWDGRLDNREDLISQLREDLRDDRTDVSIVMAAYLKWGVDFLPRMIGDFALALWDALSRTLLLARDPIGPRTLYYCADQDRMMWSTELRPLIDLSRIQLEVNEEYIADYLTRLPEPSHSPYKNVQAVPPGQAVRVSNKRLNIWRFWELNPKSEIRYRTDADYEEHFRHLFYDAIRCRLRVEGTAWAELSGGLDSSSVVCMANDVIKSGKAEASQLKTVSNVFDEAFDSDERQYIKLVEQKIACTGHYIHEDEYRMFASLLDGIGQTIPNPITNFADYYIRLNQLMCEDGGRVLLSGKGGDEILCSARDPSPELSDLLYKLKLISLHRRLKVWRRLLKKSYGDVLWRRALLPLMPEVIQGSWKRRLHPELFELYDRNFSRIMKLSRRRLGPRDVYGHRYPSGQDQAKAFLRIVRVLSAGYWKEFGNAEITYPFTHRPLVEFMHATPFDQRVRPGETRSLLRRAMRDLLPVEIANRRGKTLNTQAALLGVRREWPRLHQMFVDPLICTNGYIDREVLRSKVLLAKDGNDLAALSLWFLIPLEHWLQSFARRT